MLRQSYIYLALQVANLVIGLSLVVYLAHELEPVVFALYGFYTLIVGLFIPFTFLGYETHLIRNVLKWKQSRSTKKIVNNVSYALISRVILGFIVFILIGAFSFYISENKFNGEYSGYLLAFCVAGFFSGITDGISLSLKSFNQYVLSFIISLGFSLLSKVLALLAFINFGVEQFFFVLCVVPVLSAIVSSFCISSYFSLKVIKVKRLLKFVRYKYFIMSGYLNFFRNAADRLIVSFLITTELFAVYTIAKTLEESGRATLEGLFDPLTQRTVSMKSNPQEFNLYINRIKKIRIILVCLAIPALFLAIFFARDITSSISISNYPYITEFLIAAVIASAIQLLYKIELNVTYLIAPQRNLFLLDCIIAFLSISCLFIGNMVLEDAYLYYNRVIFCFCLLAIFTFVYPQFLRKGLN